MRIPTLQFIGLFLVLVRSCLEPLKEARRMPELCWFVGVDNLDVLFLVKDYLLAARVAHHDYLLKRGQCGD